MNSYAYLVFVTALASAVSQILLNIANRKNYPSGIREYLNPYVISSYAILFLTLAANIWIMKYVDLKTAHALASSTYLFTMILSRLILGEKITRNKIIGNILIIIGMFVFVM